MSKWHFHTHPIMERALPVGHVIIDSDAYFMVNKLKESHAKLLEACKEALGYLEKNSNCRTLPVEIYDILNQAIEKAEE